jgi:PPM family protein phosphatase
LLDESSREISFDSYSDTNSVDAYHEENQDSFFTSRPNLVFAVADGVGGYQGAKEASQIAVHIVKNSLFVLDTEEAMKSCLIEIDQRIKERSRELQYGGMGTTLALVKIIPEKQVVISANVGDSPIFLIKREDGDAIALYKDDSRRFDEPDNLWSINQYLGYGGRLSVHTKSRSYEKGDILLLCSDGVSDNLLGRTSSLSGLAALVRESKGAKTLVGLALKTRIKADDMTAILIYL